MSAWLEPIKARPWLSLTIAFTVGLLLGMGVLLWWEREDARTSIEVINTGGGLTIVISDDRNHVLFASGTDGSAFANAIDDLSNPLTGAFDLILIDPASSADVEERARALDASEIVTLPDEGQSFAPLQRMTVLLSNDLSIDVVPDSDGAWHALVNTSAGPILIRPETSEAASIAPITIQINGAASTDAPEDAVLVIAQNDSRSTPDSEISLQIGHRLTITPDGPELRLDLPDN